MCNVLHNFGKVDSKALVPVKPAASCTQSAPVPVSDSDNEVVVHNRQQSVDISNSTSIFYGANFSRATTINVQVNTK